MSDLPTRNVTEAGANHDEREIDAVVDVLCTTTLDIGERVERFEGAIAELLAKQHGVMVNSGTSAIRLAVDLIGCEPGDEVITPVVTFSSDVAPLVQSGIVPAFVDVEPDTFQIDVDRIEEMITPRTRAILAPDLVGNCPDWDRIREIADRHGLLVIEDSCGDGGADGPRPTCSGVARGRPNVSAHSPTARRTTWSSCSTMSDTTLSRRDFAMLDDACAFAADPPESHQ